MTSDRTIHHALRAAVVAAALLVWAGAAAGATQRLAVVVGANEGLPDEEPLRWAEREALAFYELLLDLGRVTPSHAYLLLGERSGDVEDVLAEVRRRVADIQQGGDVLVLFYYSGHAAADALHLAGRPLPLDRLRTALDDTGAETVIAFVDACESGALLREKGLSVLPPYEVDLRGGVSTRGRVLVTSSGPAEVSLEAEDLQGSVFSHALLSGLRGDADRDGDGRVDLDEAYEHAYHATVLRSAGTPRGAQHPAFDYDLTGTGDVVLTWPAAAAARLSVGPDASGTYLVVGKYSRRVVAELRVAPGETRALALPAQSYLVRKRVPGGQLEGDVNLTWGGVVHLAEADLRFVPYHAAADKGAPPPDRNDLDAGFLVRNGVVPGNDLLLGAVVAYRRLVGARLLLGGAVAWGDGVTDTAEHTLATRGLELHVDAFYAHQLGRVRLRVGGSLGASVFWQELPGGDRRHSPGGSAAFAAGATWVPADPFVVALGFRAGVEAQREEGALAWAPTVGASAGLGLRF